MKKSILFCSLFLVTSLLFAQSNLYISPSGDDMNDGLSTSTPLQSLEGARDMIRNFTSPQEVTVWLMDGDYYRTTSFELTSQDSGTASQRITYRAMNKHGAKLHLNKSVPVSSFEPLSDPNLIDRIDPAAVGQIMTLDLATLGVENMDTWPDYFPASNQELFRIYTDQDGQLPLSRYPNDSMMTMEKVLSNEDPGIFIYRGDRHSRWLDAVNDGLWFQGYWRVAWQFDAVRTAAIDTTAKTVTQLADVPLGIGDKYTRPCGNGMEPYFATNLLEEIDIEGEWSVNFNNDTLYIWIPAGATEVKILDQDIPIFKLSSVDYIDIIDLEFDYGLGSAIIIENGYDNKVAGCNITNFIEDAIRVLDGNSHDIVSNDLHHLGAGGIYLSGGERYSLTHAGHTAVNNHIYEFGQVKVIYAPAIGLPRKYDENNVGMYVAHNKIHGTPHVGIELCGNDNIFEYNEIFDICRVSNDMGAFYSWNDWTSYGNKFRYNYIHDAHQAHGTYFDDGDSGDEVHNNVFQNIDDAVFIGGGHDIYAHNNLAINCDRGVHIDNRGVSRGYNLSNTSMVNRVLSVDYQNPPWSTQYPTIVNILDPSYEQELPTNCEISCNVAINTGQGVDIDAATATSWGVILGTNYTDTDPALASASLSQIAAANSYNGASCIGVIPYTEIGLQDDAYRTVCLEDNPIDTTFNTTYSIGTHLQTASNSLTSNSLIEDPTDMTFWAGNCIALNPDFEVEIGAEFLAEIRDACANTSPLTNTPNQVAQRRAINTIKPVKKNLQSDIFPQSDGSMLLYYQLSGQEEVRILISDARGKLIQKLKSETRQVRGTYQVPIACKTWAKGTYYYTIETENGGETKPFEVE